MSVELYDFLDYSILLDEFHGPGAASEDRLLTELESYRSHVLQSVDGIREGLRPRTNGPKAFVAAAARTTVDRSIASAHGPVF